MSKENLSKMSKKRLIYCISKTADDYGLTSGEFQDYSEKRLSTDKKDYISVYPKVPDITVSGDKMYVTNLKVMLAQNLYVGNKIVKLNDKLTTMLKIPEPPIGWYVSEKFDGIRALWDGEKFVLAKDWYKAHRDIIKVRLEEVAKTQ